MSLRDNQAARGSAVRPGVTSWEGTPLESTVFYYLNQNRRQTRRHPRHPGYARASSRLDAEPTRRRTHLEVSDTT